MPSGAAQLPSRRVGRCRHRPESAWVAEHRRRCRPSEGGLGRVAGGRRRRGRRGCPDAGHAVRRAVRVLCPPCGRTSVQLVGRTSGVQGERCPRDRGDPGCPDGHTSGVRGLGSRAVLAALDPEGVGAADRPRWRTGWSVVVVGEWLGRRCPSRVWRGRGWSGVGSAWLARVSTADLGRRLACVQAAAPRSPPG
jgi:hypothetical protein